MAKIWKPNQLKALQAKEGKYLIAAGAGSGKTTVLTHRILELIKDKSLGVTFDNLLVLTFTKKAAAEMKERTRTLVLEDPDPEIQALLPEVETATISTFDSFALSIVKQYHYELGLPSDVINLDTSIEYVLKRRFLEEMIEERCEKALDDENDPFGELMSRFALDDDEEIINLVLRLTQVAENKENPYDFLDGYIEHYFDDPSFFDGILERHCQEAMDAFREAKTYIPYLNNPKVASFLESFPEDFDLFSATVWTENKRKPFPSKPRKKDGAESDYDEEAHEQCKELYYKAVFMAIFPKAMLREQYYATKGDCAVLVELAKELLEKMDKYCFDHACFTFAGIANLARSLIKEDPEVARKLRERYRYIMVDEYQDTNDLQENFINSLASDNLFQVGDIKQSIYGFRNANPSLFAAKSQLYREDNEPKDGILITLDDNFRSREPVLSSINDLFLKVMTLKHGGVDYSNRQKLNFAQSAYHEEDDSHKSEIFYYKLEDGEKRQEYEAKLIAEDIIEKIRDRYPISEKGGTRPCEFGDFAILVDKRTELDYFRKVFNEYKIPFEATDKGDALQKDISIVIKNLSKLAVALYENDEDSPLLRHLYASLSRSFIIRESDENIYKSLKGNSYLESPLFQLVRSKAAELVEGDPVDAIAYLIDAFSIVEKLPLIGSVKVNYAVIEYFQNLASTFSKLGYGLKDFAAYFDDMKRFEYTFAIEPSPTGVSSVSFMTIHQSKGLEFPIVYVAGLSHRFNLRRALTGASGNFLVDPEYGISLPSIIDGRVYNSIIFDLVKRREHDECLSEEIRLFYVALTRAKEKLILLSRGRASEEGPGFKERKSVDECKSFEELLGLYDNGKRYFRESERCLVHNRLFVETFIPKAPSIEFRSIALEAEVSEQHRISKKAGAEVDRAALRYGEHLHRLLEVSSFAEKDVGFIDDPKERELILKVLNLPLFEKAKDAHIFHEYRFYDDQNEVYGIIDLLLVYDDHIDLVDFKAKNIDDPAYAEQLSGYESYLKQVFPQRIDKYLLSIKETRLKRVE